MSNKTKHFIRAKYILPQIGFTYCDDNGWILEDQTKPSGEITDNLNDNEIMQQLRDYRNQLLRDCDWTQLPDVDFTAEQVLAWRTYRKALRDFPSKIDIINWAGPDWPTPPE